MGVGDSPQGDTIGLGSRLCVRSMEQGPGALNGKVKTDDAAPSGSVGQRARELCFCQETAPSLPTPAPCSSTRPSILIQRCLLTRPHF